MTGPSEATSKAGIIWLASYPRSGNTWLRMFTDTLLRLIHDRPPGTINDLQRSIMWEANLPELFRRVLGKPPSERDRREVAAARNKVQEIVADQAKGRVFLKTHMAAIKADGAFAINWKVTAGAVYLVRNPLDVACSLAPHHGYSLEAAAEQLGTRDARSRNSPDRVSETIGSWSQNVASWTDNKLPLRPHVMRYEDMVERPAETFAAFTRYIGGGVTDDQIAQTVALCSFGRLQEQERQAGYRERPDFSTASFFREGRVGQWRDRLPAGLVQRIVAAHGAQMTRFGYWPG
jgi:hypothetical protein